MARNKYDVDETLEEAFNFTQVKRILKYIKPYRKQMLLTLVIMILANSASLVGPYLTQQALSFKIPQKDVWGLVQLSMIFFLSLIVTGVCMKYRLKWMAYIGQNVLVDLRQDLFTHLQTLPFDYYDNRPHGKILVRVVNYVNSLSDLLSNGVMNLLTDILSLIIAIIFMLFIDVRLTCLTLLGMPVMFLVIILLKNAQRKAHQQLSAKQSNLNAYIHESISGIKVTQSFARGEENTDILRQVSKEYKKAWIQSVKLNFLLWPAIDTISILTVCLVYVGAILYFNDLRDVGIIVGFIGYVWRFWAPIVNIGNFYNQIITATAYLERIFETLDEQPDIYDAEDAEEMPSIQGQVKFKEVTFGYEADKNILQDLSFDVETGQSIALVGPTGAGKSTIVSLLSRFYDVQNGEVLIDGINIKSVKLNSLRRQMGVMLQDTFIFSGTIMDNIRYGKLDASDEEVIAAAKVVRAHDFISQLTQGYQTQVNERGSRLSQGQRQLISFARTLLADPKILILDEATAAIDTKTEALLQIGLEELLKGRTSFIIAHRLSTIQKADQIMYVNNQTITESGTHEELLKKNGAYKELYESQFRFLNMG